MVRYAGRETVVGTGFDPSTTHLAVGIDQSWTGFGLSFVDMDNPKNYKTYVYQGSKGEDDTARLMDIAKWLEEKWLDHNSRIVSVAMEGYAFASQRAHMAGEIGGMVKLFLRGQGMKPTIVAPTQLKKYVAGKGTGVTKSQMLLACYMNWGVAFKDDNAADSYGLARIAGNFYSGETQRSVLEKLGLTQDAA